MSERSELERLTARRVTLIYRLDMIAKGATLTYDDGTPVEMLSEKTRLEDEVKQLDRRILLLQPSAGQA